MQKFLLSRWKLSQVWKVHVLQFVFGIFIEEKFWDFKNILNKHLPSSFASSVSISMKIYSPLKCNSVWTRSKVVPIYVIRILSPTKPKDWWNFNWWFEELEFFWTYLWLNNKTSCYRMFFKNQSETAFTGGRFLIRHMGAEYSLFVTVSQISAVSPWKEGGLFYCFRIIVIESLGRMVLEMFWCWMPST